MDITDISITFVQKFLVLQKVIPLFIKNNIKTRNIEPRDNNIIKFLYYFSPSL